MNTVGTERKKRKEEIESRERNGERKGDTTEN